MTSRGQHSAAKQVGLIAFGAYIPLFRLSRDVIAAAWGSRSLGGERSVGNYDEDSVTMAVEAARDCLQGMDRSTIDGLYFASTSAPYREKGCATLIARVLDLPRRTLTADFATSLRSGTSALLAAVATVASGRAQRILVVASDCRLGYPRTDNEQLFGDAAAAVLVGRSGIAASVDAFVSHIDEIHDMWRRDSDTFVRSWEDRFRLEEGYARNLQEAITALIDQENLTSKDAIKLVVSAPDTRSSTRLARALGFDTTGQFQDPLIGSVGACGAAQAILLLAAALEEARAGQRLLLGNYGDGADALLFTAKRRVAQGRRGLGVQGHLSSKKALPTYQQYAAFRGIVPLQPEPPLRVFPFSGASITWREQRSILNLYGSRCDKCGTTHFPIQRVCFSCRSRDEYTEVPLADKPATVFTFSRDYLAGGTDPPVAKGVLVSEEGEARIDCLFTDCDPQDIKVGLPMGLVFRRFHEAADMHNYFWKARPVRDARTEGASLPHKEGGTKRA